jgi:hypothetical protein
LKGSRGTSSRKVKEAYQGGGVCYVEERRKEENECVRKKISLLCVWKGVVHEKDVCKN